MKNLAWLVSYPKSGNTWVRVFLANYTRDAASPVDINDLERLGANSRSCFDELAGVEASELTAEEVRMYRPAVYRQISAQSDGLRVIKVHEAFGVNGSGEPIFPADVTRHVVYIARNPLDVAVSFAHHCNVSPECAVGYLCQEDFTLDVDPSRMYDHLPQRLLSWAGHAASWLDGSALPALVVRYEDMIDDPHSVFAGVLTALGLPVEPERLARAIEFSAFEELRRQERRHGFRERPARAASFFREGGVGNWRESLTPVQVGRILEVNGPMMKRFGY